MAIRPPMLIAAGLVAATIACRPASNRETRASRDATSVTRDDYGDDVVTTGPAPNRVVSLNPATTAMLFAMGESARVVGRTKWDTYPPGVQVIPSVGDGLRPNVEAVLARHPDLVVLYASNDDRAAAQAFQRAGIATVSMRVDRVADFARALDLLGLVMHDSAAAAAVRDSVLATIAHVRAQTTGLSTPTVVWILDESPLRVLGAGSYLNTLLADAGGRNLYADLADPAPLVSLEDVLHRNPDDLLLSPSAAAAMRADPRWQSWLHGSGHRVLVPDTALVGMPSVRMGQAAVQLAGLLHPAGAH
jgi:ABC-type Fe3+-hydroxamate transport system substrate-binding protein